MNDREIELEITRLHHEMANRFRVAEIEMEKRHTRKFIHHIIWIFIGGVVVVICERYQLSGWVNSIPLAGMEISDKLLGL